MIVGRKYYRLFSDIKNEMIDKLTSRLEKERLYDFEVTDRIQRDVISISSNLSEGIRIYIPTEFEYSQYDIDDYIRDVVPFSRPSTVLDRNIYVMKIPGKLTFEQYFRIVKFIIESEEFCSIIDNN